MIEERKQWTSFIIIIIHLWYVSELLLSACTFDNIFIKIIALAANDRTVRKTPDSCLIILFFSFSFQSFFV
ncbi:hypothetical protein T05_14825 [Trichinella murrelli]|uniref:Uncharacterized protein n=1 Tax=Trichinella murrelli TaxID=144512 RepID=A0A0V0TKH5_9BILA|nr:hypothetical protein T05_14825 [Trichinella murrelli]